MITLFGTFPEVEALTIDLRRTLLALGLLVVRETDTETKGRWVRRLEVRTLEG